MALSEAEQLELAQLEQELSPTLGGLTPEEHMEMKALEAELNTQPQAPISHNLNNKRMDQFSPAEAALQGFGESATLGYLPKMQAAVMAGLDPDLNYEQAKEITQKRASNITEQNPVSYGAGAIGGALATPIPGLGAVKGASLGAKAGKAALQGAAIGGVSDTGLGVGSKDDLKARLQNAAFGGAIGGTAQGVGSGLQSLASKLKEYGTFKLLGARGKDAEKLLERNKAGLQKLDTFLDEEKLTGPLTTNADLAKRADKLASESGKKIGAVYDKVEKEAQDLLSNTPIASSNEGAQAVNNALSTRLDPKEMAQDFFNKAKSEYEGTANGDQILRSVRSQLQNLSKVKSEKGIKGVVEFRQSLDDALKKTYEKPAADIGDKQEAMIALRRYIKDRTNEHIDAIDSLVGSSSSRELKKLNNTFANASTVRRITSKSEIAQMRNSGLGLPELIVGAGATSYQMTKDDPVSAAAKGVGAAAAYKLSRSYGPAMSRSTANVIQKSPSIPVRGIVTPWINMKNEK